MRILICKNDNYGGANLLLDRLYAWLKRNSYEAEICIVNKGEFPPSGRYELAILPSYIIDHIYSLKKRNIIVERMLVWIMGMGCFQDGYYNPRNTTGIKGLITRLLSVVAEKALEDFKKNKSICFTDVVGRYNTFKMSEYADENFQSYNLIPIGIVPNFNIKKREKGDLLKCCWVGRVSHDFKFIPLSHSLIDMDLFCEKNNIEACFTIVGDGDALYDIKELEKDLKKIKIKYIRSILYEKLNDFFATQDIAFVMGTSALDAARNMCATIVVTPVRPGIDEPSVFYRWIFESKGYSLGEYPGWDRLTNQVMNGLDDVLKSYFDCNDIQKLCWNYTLQYDENKVFEKLLNVSNPQPINSSLWFHIKIYYIIKKMIGLYLKYSIKK